MNTVHLRPGSQARFSDVLIDGGTIGLRIEGSKAEITDSFVEDCTIGLSVDRGSTAQIHGTQVTGHLVGVFVNQGGRLEMRHSRIYGNSILNLSLSSCGPSDTLDVIHNWWGTVQEDEILLKIQTTCPGGSFFITHEPWCADPDCQTIAQWLSTWGQLRLQFPLTVQPRAR